MSFDCSRFSFHPWKDFFGVVMQQGRVQLDSDWNEWVAELARRLQAGTLDTVGRAVVPRTTPNGFRILATAGALTIGPGRLYVDGLLAENHGAQPAQWDATLAELTGTGDVPFFGQPYLPFNATDQAAPADIFNRPALTGGPHLVYLDVWQREVTHVQEPALVEKAVGVDTTARLQTVWQVKVLAGIDNANCATPDSEVPGWAAVIRPSAGRLTNSTGDVPGDPDPCLVPPTAGYKGLENQLYRVEIHRGGGQGTATFKWSRDNATVATRVIEIQGGNRLVVESVGRDEVLGFHAGDWIEILDDWHELHGRPGLLRRIRSGDGVDAATRSILLEDALPAGLFPVDAQGRTNATRHTRIRRWDQSGLVRRADGSTFHDLNASASSDGIPLPPAGTRLALENGILVEFDLDPAGGEYRAGDYWVFAARVADGSIEPLDHAPPRGIHHHYARLAVVTLPDSETDCRVFWPPEAVGESCDCTVCVHPEGHNAGTATIQQAIDSIRQRGGTICLDTGTYRLDAPLNLEGVRSLRIRGQGWQTLLQGAAAGPLMRIAQGIGVTVENLALVGAAAGGGTTALIEVAACIDLHLVHLAVLGVAAGDATSAAVGLSGSVLAASIRDCTLVAEQGVAALTGERNYLLTGQCRVTDNVFLCSQRGVSFAGMSLHYGELRLAGNLLLRCSQAGVVVTGGALPAASIAIAGNLMHITGAGVVAGTGGLRIVDNEIVGSGEAAADGIVLEPGLDKVSIDRVMIHGNRIRGLRGNGLAIRQTLGRAMIKSNVIEDTGLGALVMERKAGAAYLCLENNQFSNLGAGFNQEGRPFFGVLLADVARADVVNNLFAGVARQANQSPLRAALLAVASGELRVAGNRMFGIGPQSFLGRTVGLAVGASFSQLAVEDNSLARLEGTETTSAAAWQAIVVAPSGAAQGGPAGGTTVTAPGVMVLPVKEGYLYLSAFRARILASLARGNTSLRGNRLRGTLTVMPLVEIDDVLSCLFDQNDAELSSVVTAGPAPLVGRIGCDHASVANNRLVGVTEFPTLSLTARNFAVLGNLTSGAIQVNGTALPAPWNALNVHI